jgi:hypothetical protein
MNPRRSLLTATYRAHPSASTGRRDEVIHARNTQIYHRRIPTVARQCTPDVVHAASYKSSGRTIVSVIIATISNDHLAF